MNKFLFITQLLLSSFSLSAQFRTPDGGGKYENKTSECISLAEKIKIKHEIDSTVQYLKSIGAFDKLKQTRSVALSLPLKQATGFNYCNFYAISNYVDHNANYPNQIQDYNCGTRSYDLSSGYNHSGTDYFLWPFDWNMMAQNQVEVIAAAPGIIVGKYDGNYDLSCGSSGSGWNAVYVQHSDGSVAWYGHMKSGSLTPKNVGDLVVVGEKLGNIGSSGFSTGPHLHFELYDAANNLTDPYSGPCNTTPTWWSPARSYYEPTVNAAFTHSFPPSFNTCPLPVTTNLKDTFYCSDNIYFIGYFRDEQLNQNATYTVKRPNGTVFNSWIFSSIANYSAFYWYWNDVIPINAPTGTWTFDVSYMGQTCTHPFEVICNIALPISEIKLTAFDINNQSNLFWTVDEEDEVKQYDIEVSLNGNDFQLLTSIENSNQKSYQFVDKTEYKTNPFYRIKAISIDNKIVYSKIVEVKKNNEQQAFSFYPNPAQNELSIIGAKTPVQIYSMFNQLLLESEDSKINLIEFNNGIYFLHVNDQFFKFIIQK